MLKTSAPVMAVFVFFGGLNLDVASARPKFPTPKPGSCDAVFDQCYWERCKSQDRIFQQACQHRCKLQFERCQRTEP